MANAFGCGLCYSLVLTKDLTSDEALKPLPVANVNEPFSRMPSWVSILFTCVAGGAIAFFIFFFSLSKPTPSQQADGEKTKKRKQTSVRPSLRSKDSDVKTLKVSVKRATQLPPMDSDGLADPYVVVRCGGEERVTRKLLNTRFPSWNETFLFTVSKASTQPLHLRVMDWDSESADDLIGTVSIDMQTALKTVEPVEIAYDLRDASGTKVKSQEGNPSMLFLELSYMEGKPESNDLWVNHVMTKVLTFFRTDINDKVEEAFKGQPLIQRAVFDIGDEAPLFCEIKPLLTRAKEDIQINCHVHWEPPASKLELAVGFSFFTIDLIATGIQLDVPAWIRVRLNKTDAGYEPALLQFAATECPQVAFKLEWKFMQRVVEVPFFRSFVENGVRVLVERFRNNQGKPKKLSKELKAVSVVSECKDVGRLSLTIQEAVYLAAKNTFVRVTLGKERAETRTIQHARYPAWNETLELPVASYEEQLTVQIMQDTGEKACVELKLWQFKVSELCSAGDRWHQLDEPGSALRVGSSYERYADAQRELQAWQSTPNAQQEAVPRRDSRLQRGKATLWINQAKNINSGEQLYIKVIAHGDDDNVEQTVLLRTAPNATIEDADGTHCLWDEVCYMTLLEGDPRFEHITLQLKYKHLLGSSLLGEARMSFAELKERSKDGRESDPWLIPFKKRQPNGAELKDPSQQTSALRVAVTWAPEAGCVVESSGPQCQWINRALSQAYQLYHAEITQMIHGALKGIIENLPFDQIPLVHSLTMSKKMRIGARPPLVQGVEYMHVDAENLIELALHLSWVVDRDFLLAVDANVELPVLGEATGIGSGLVMEFPAWVQLNLKGAQGPGQPLLKIAALEEPGLHFDLALEGVGPVPSQAEAVLREVLRNSILMALKDILVLPRYLQIPADPDVPLPELDRDKRAMLESEAWREKMAKLDRIPVKGRVELRVPRAHTGRAATLTLTAEMMVPHTVTAAQKAGLKLADRLEIKASSKPEELQQSFVLDVVDVGHDQLSIKVAGGEEGPLDWTGTVAELVPKASGHHIPLGGINVTIMFWKVFHEGCAVVKKVNALRTLRGGAGDLEVEVCRVEHLPRNSRVHTGSPYGRRFVTVTAGEVRKATGVWDQPGQAMWRQRLWFQSATLEQLEIDVQDEETNRVLGSVAIPAKELRGADDQVKPYELQLKGRTVVNSNKQHATLFVRTKLHSQRKEEAPAQGSGSEVDATGHGGGVVVDRGKVRVEVHGASDLKNEDAETWTPGDLSDPYVVLMLGGDKFRTEVIKDNLNPTWNAAFEFSNVMATSTQALAFEVFDRDTKKKFDDFLGRVSVSVAAVVKGDYAKDTALQLLQKAPSPHAVRERLTAAHDKSKTPLGRAHGWWWSRQKDDEGRPSKLHVRITYHRYTREEVAQLRMAHVSVQIVRCKDLPKTDRGASNHCDAYVRVDLSGQSQATLCRTSVQAKQRNPHWESARFDHTCLLSHLPEKLRFEVWDKNWRADEHVGTASLPISDIRDASAEDGAGHWSVDGLPLLDKDGQQVQFNETAKSRIFVKAWVRITDS